MRGSTQQKSQSRNPQTLQLTEFPLQTKLRFVPAFPKLMDIDSIGKFRVLANRQDGWAKQHMARSRDDIIEIDRSCRNMEKTLRELIMSIKGKDSKYPLFASIDQKWNGQGFNFSFHPDKAIEANMTIRGLYPRLAHEYSEENISAFFSPRAVSEGRYMKYDLVKKAVTTEADESIFELSSIDKDMEVKYDKPTNMGAQQVFEKERQENDSVSTF